MTGITRLTNFSNNGRSIQLSNSDAKRLLLIIGYRFISISQAVLSHKDVKHPSGLGVTD